MCVFCPISLILPYLVKNKPSNYDVPFQAILSSFFSFPTIKAKVYVVISVNQTHTHTHTHTPCVLPLLKDRQFQAYGILQFYMFMLSVLLC
jgi:hypothetical protein